MAKRNSKKTTRRSTKNTIGELAPRGEAVTSMNLKVGTLSDLSTRNHYDAVVTFVKKGQRGYTGRLSSHGKILGGAISAALDEKRFDAKFKDLISLFPVDLGFTQHVLAVGLGAGKEVGEADFVNLGGIVSRRLRMLKLSTALIDFPPYAGKLSAKTFLPSFLLGMHLANFSLQRYRSEAGEKKQFDTLPPGPRLDILTKGDGASTLKEVKSSIEYAAALNNGITTTRCLVGGPSNHITPSVLAREAQSIGRRFKMKVTVMDKPQLKREGFTGLLAVNQGSEEPPKFIVMEYYGAARSKAPIVVVGKGVTFDTGGISLKPSLRMEAMIYDMAGAGCTLGVMHAVGALRLKANVVALIPTTDNMPSGNAYKPGDILTFKNGKTVEIISTDAEGRLILADALIYSERFKPQALLDMATLTGACSAMVGEEAAGVFSNNEQLEKDVFNAGKETGEGLWPMPNFPAYRRMLDCLTADMKNVGTRYAGASTAAFFLKEFVPENTAWMHFDIAGCSWYDRDRDAISTGPSAVPVRTILRFIQNRFRG